MQEAENTIATTPEEVTDATVDTYFQSQGEEGVGELPENNETEDQTEETKEEAQVATKNEDEQEDRQDEPEKEGEQNDKQEDKKNDIGHNLNAALKQEREKRKGLSSELEQTKGQLQQLQEMMNKVLGPEDAQSQEIKYEDDPIEYLRQNQERINKQLEQQTQQQTQQQQTHQQLQAQQQLVTTYQQAALDFKKEAPDFDQAYEYLTNGRMAEYTAAGYSKEEATQLLQEDEFAIAAKAFTDEANPAQRVYELAKARGYQKQPQNDNNIKKLEQVEKGQRTNSSLSDAQGGSSNKSFAVDNLRLQDIDKMSDADLDKVFNQLKQKG